MPRDSEVFLIGAGGEEAGWRDAQLGNQQLRSVLYARQEQDDVRFVRLCIYLSDSSAEPGDSLFITYEWRSIPNSERWTIVDKIRGKSTEATAEYIVASFDKTKPSMEAWNFWKVNDVGGFAQTATDISDLQGSLHNLLVGEPVEKTLSALEVPGAAEAGFFAEQINLGSVDQFLGKVKLGVEIAGIAIGILSGQPHMVCACFKDWTQDKVHGLMASGIKSIIAGDRPIVTDDSSSVLSR
jgi:hypothetical protein